MKKSLTLWNTNRGMRELKSGELCPSLNLINLRYYPKFGFGVNEWSFDVGVLVGVNPVKTLKVDDFVYDGNYFNLNIKFKSFTYPSTIRITATHVPTGKVDIVWQGEVVSNSITLTCNQVGLSSTWDVNAHLKELYPDVCFEHFTIPTIELIVPNSTMLIANPVSNPDEVSVPILIQGFTRIQRFNVLVEGFVIGHGGNGGDAGISTVTDTLEIIEPTAPTHGGQICNRPHGVNFELGEYGFVSCGENGKSASAFAVNNVKQRTTQIGRPGAGGWPNGINGRLTEVQYRFKHARAFSDPKPIMAEDLSITFIPAVIDIKQTPFESNKFNCIQPPPFDDSYASELKIISAIEHKDGVYVTKI